MARKCFQTYVQLTQVQLKQFFALNLAYFSLRLHGRSNAARKCLKTVECYHKAKIIVLHIKFLLSKSEFHVFIIIISKFEVD